jgi:hypothetical protein
MTKLQAFRRFILPLVCAILLAGPLHAQGPGDALPFSAEAGDRLLQTETEHFLFIYRASDLPALTELLLYAEDSYDKLTPFFGEQPEKIHCILNGATDSANGYFSPLPAPHLSVNSAAPTVPLIGARTESWLKALFIHELVHYLQLTTETGLFHFLSGIFGSSLKSVPFAFMPGWAVEGSAVLAETLCTEGGRGRNPFFELYYKAAVIEDNLFPYEKAAYSSAYPPPGRFYVAGYLIISYLYETYGIDALIRINNEFLRFPPFGMARAVEVVTGKSIEDVYTDMSAALEKKYEPFRNLPEGRALQEAGFADYYLPLSSEDALFVYRSRMDRVPALVEIDPDTGREEVIIETELSDYSSFSISRDGQTAALSQLRIGFDMRGANKSSFSLSLYDRRSGRLREIPNTDGFYQPALSPDGERLIAVERQGSYSQLTAVDIHSGEEAVLYAVPGSRVFNPVFSPSGSAVAFALRRNGKQDIVYAGYNSSSQSLYGIEVLPPTAGKAAEYFPRFVSESEIYYSSDRSGSLKLYSYDRESGRERLVFEEQVAAFCGLPFEDRLIYSSYRSSGYSLRTVPRAHTAAELSFDAHNRRNLTGDDSDQRMLSAESGEPQSAGDADSSLPAHTSPYHSYALPRLFYPYPGILTTSAHPVDLGIGLAFSGESLLGDSRWYLQGALHPSVMQPAGEAGLILRGGPLELECGIEQDYYFLEARTTAVQSSRLKALMRLYILGEFSAALYRSISFYSGLQHDYFLYSNEGDFSFFSSAPAISRRSDLSVIGGLSFFFGNPGSSKDLYYPASFYSGTAVAVPLPADSGFIPGLRAVSALEAAVPLGFLPHHRIKLGLDAGFMSPALLSRYGSRLTGSRGFSAPAKHRTGSYAASLDYQFTAAITDLPLPFGLSLHGIGVGFYGEIHGEWTLYPPALSLDPVIYGGLELLIITAVNVMKVPVRFGTELRFHTAGDTVFRVPEDIAVYIDFDLGGIRLPGTGEKSYLREEEL